MLPGQQVDLTAEFSDPGVNDTHTCEVTWATGVTTPGTVTGTTCTASYTYTTTGLNNISVRVPPTTPATSATAARPYSSSPATTTGR